MNSELNPYESPQAVEDVSTRRPNRRRIKRWWEFLLASAVGGFIIGPLFLPITANIDDSGGIQMMVGAILVPLIYQLFF